MIESVIIEDLISKYGKNVLEYLDLDLLEKATKSFHIVVQKLPQELFLYRGRKNIDTEKEDISNPQTFSYPPIQYCNENGRAHVFKKPVFYCAESFYTTLFELRADVDDYIYIGLWRLKNFALTKIHFNVAENNIDESIFYSTYKNMIEQLHSKYPDYIKSNESIKKIYTEECFPYINSSLFSYYLLYKKDIDFIIYPSTQTNDMYPNIAIKPEFVDNYMELDTVFLVKVGVDSKFFITLNLNQVGTVENNKIEWRNSLKSDFEIFATVVDGYSNILKNTNPNFFVVENATTDKLTIIAEEARSELIMDIIKKEDSNDRKKHSNLFSLGLDFFYKEQYLNALKILNRAIKECIYQPKYYYFRAACYFMLKNYSDAKQDCRRVFELGNSKYIYATFCLLGQVYSQEKNYPQALSNYKLAYDINKTDFVLLTKIGDCFIQIDKKEEAIEFLEKAAKTNPDVKLISYIDHLKKG